MLHNRIIPVLLLSDGGLVKTTRFKDPKYVGDPINAIRIFNEKEVDELTVIDIRASRENRGPDYQLVEDFASECFMPLAFGGGLKDIDQAHRLFSLGIEKVVLQTAAYADLNTIEQIARRYGSQSVVVSADVKRNWLGKPGLWSSYTRKSVKGEWTARLKDFEQAGAGEIYLNAVDRDGCLNGYDLPLVSEAAGCLDIPLVALGGAKEIDDFARAVDAGASAAAAGSMFVFQGPHKAVLISYPPYNQLEELFRGENVRR